MFAVVEDQQVLSAKILLEQVKSDRLLGTV